MRRRIPPQSGQRGAGGEWGGWVLFGTSGCVSCFLGIILEMASVGRGLLADRNRMNHCLSAVMSDLHESLWQDMLEEPSNELHDVEGGDVVVVCAVSSIFEGDGTVFDLEDAAIRDRDLEYVGC